MTELYLSGDPKADALISKDPLALLIGMVLDQQITVEKAFRGPADMAERLGLPVPLDARRIAAMDPDLLVEAFSRMPALHRYPASMATRVQELARVVADDYGGDASALWRTAPDGRTLLARAKALPGFGVQKAKIFVALCAKQLGVTPAGWEEAAEPYGEKGSFRSVADIVDAASLAEVRRQKQEMKAAAKAAKAPAKAAKRSTAQGRR